MRKYKIIINCLLILLAIGSIIAFSLICELTTEHWEWLKTSSEYKDEPFYNPWLKETLCLTFSIIFSAICATVSAVTFFLLNFKVWKANKN